MLRFLLVELDVKAKFTKERWMHETKLLSRSLGAAASIKKREDQPRRTTSDLRTRVAEYIEVDGGIFENLL